MCGVVTWYRVATNDVVGRAPTYPVGSCRVVPPICLGTREKLFLSTP